MIEWLVLTASLPSSPSGLRVRIWRALRATSCATLRDGVYILPASAPSASDLWAIAKAIQDGGADAHMLQLQARDEVQETTFRALFNRSERYAEFAQSLKQARKALKTATEADLRKRLRTLEQRLLAIRAADYFPNPASQKTVDDLQTLRAEIEHQLSPGEPTTRGGDVERLAKESFQGRTWATRRRPWMDRLATAWLVQRFVDAKARFLWLDDTKKCPKSALGFDFDGARFSHMEDKVTFEVVLHSFGLESDPALRRLGEIVHCIDIGGIPVDEAPGIEAMVRGLQAQHDDDDALLAAACSLFDTLHAALRLAP